jgi:3-phosphoshikimate 1-carboxyvinyltransferase
MSVGPYERGVLPGDKSISHRLLLLSLLADGPCRLRHLNAGDDVSHTRACVVALGATLVDDDGVTTVVPPATLHTPASDLDCGNAGTLARLLMGLLVGQRTEARLVGDASLSARPMARVALPLARLIGADVVELSPSGTLPARVISASFDDGEATREVSTGTKSAQVKSALLLAALGCHGRVVVREPVPTRRHTERLLAHLGVPVTMPDDTTVVVDAGPRRVRAFSLSAPGDPSAAAFRVVLALGRGMPLVLDDVLIGARRAAFIDVLARAGAGVRTERVAHTQSAGFEDFPDEVGRIVVDDRACVRGISSLADESADIIDEIPALAMLAATRAGTHVFAGVDELRVKESDRLALLVRGLTAFGVSAHAEGNDLVVLGSHTLSRGGPVRIETGSDHRIAMAFLTLGAITGREVHVDDPHCVAVSEPGFMNALRVLSDGMDPPP